MLTDVTQHGELRTTGLLSGKWTIISESILGQKLSGKIYWKPQNISAARPTLYNSCPLKWESRRHEHSSRQICLPSYHCGVFSGGLFLDSGVYDYLEGVRKVTDLSSRKTKCVVQFSDAVRERGRLREVIFHLTPYGIEVRLKGMRQAFQVSPASVYNLAVQKEVNRRKAEKKAGKK